jgi:hypothetical protein
LPVIFSGGVPPFAQFAKRGISAVTPWIMVFIFLEHSLRHEYISRECPTFRDFRKLGIDAAEGWWKGTRSSRKGHNFAGF